MRTAITLLTVLAVLLLVACAEPPAPIIFALNAPPLPLPPAMMSPEDVIRHFWQAIDAEDYVTAYATRASDNRARTGLAYFQADWECVDRARVLEIAPMGEAAGNERMATVQVELRVKPTCDGWRQPGSFASLVRESPDGPWLIQAFNTGP